MEEASPCLCSYSGTALQANLPQAVEKNRQLDEMSAKVLEMSTKCVLRVMLINYHWIKSNISLVAFSPGNAETNVK